MKAPPIPEHVIEPAKKAVDAPLKAVTLHKAHSALLACFSSHTFSRATMLQDDVLSFHCLARRFSRPERSASCRSTCALHGHAYGCTYHVSCVTRLTHMCHDMTGAAIIMAGRLGTRIFCLPLAGVACHGLIA